MARDGAGVGTGAVEGRSHEGHARGPVAGRGAGKRRSVRPSPKSDQGSTVVGVRLVRRRRAGRTGCGWSPAARIGDRSRREPLPAIPARLPPRTDEDARRLFMARAPLGSVARITGGRSRTSARGGERRSSCNQPHVDRLSIGSLRSTTSPSPLAEHARRNGHCPVSRRPAGRRGRARSAHRSGAAGCPPAPCGPRSAPARTGASNTPRPRPTPPR